jgi:hypothetical protein
MTETLDYHELSSEDVVARFHRDGSVTVRVPERHANACATLIEVCRAVQQWHGSRTSVFRVARVLARGLALTARMIMFHSQLSELASLLIGQQPDSVRTRDQSGDHLFCFTPRHDV